MAGLGDPRRVGRGGEGVGRGGEGWGGGAKGREGGRRVGRGAIAGGWRQVCGR